MKKTLLLILISVFMFSSFTSEKGYKSIFNGKNLLMIVRPYLYTPEELNVKPLEITLNDSKINPECLKEFPIEKFPRIRVRWEGAEFRARKRNASWKGTAEFTQNQILSTRTFNFWNEDAPLKYESNNIISWDTITSGNFQGFDVDLQHPFKGKLLFQSSQINFELPIDKILIKDTIFDVGGVGKKVCISRYSQNNPHISFTFQTNIPLTPTPTQDERIFVKVTLENGHQAWSSPMYFIRQ